MPAGDWWRQLRWTLRRWSIKHLWYRMLLPGRRSRWHAACLAAAKPFAKSTIANKTTGPALVLGDFSGTHGLSIAAGYDLNIIGAIHTRVYTVNIHAALAGEKVQPTTLPDDIENVYFLCQPDTFDLALNTIQPDQIANCYRIARWVWETPLFPHSWMFAEAMIHEVWTPSRFCADTFQKAVKIPVRVVPYDIQPNTHLEISDQILDRFALQPSTFVGLAIMDLRTCPERKNPWDHVRAWKAAFQNDPTAVLILKARVSRRTSVVLAELRELIGDCGNIRLLNADLAAGEIAALQKRADVFLSLHRSEGYGLNIVEALLAGSPVLATNWSANAEYGPNYPNYEPLDYTLVNYCDWTGHYADKRFVWAQVDWPDATSKLQKLRQNSRTTAEP